MSKILITGANGFIGANIVRAALKLEYDVKALVRKTSDLSNINGLPIELCYGDLRNEKALENAMEGCEFIIHNGGIYVFSPLWFRATDKLMKIAHQKEIKKVIYTSSESAIGMPSDGSLGNEELFASKRELSGYYKRSKYLGELVALKWNKKGLPTCTILPTTPMGPYDIKPTPTGRIVMDFMNGKMPGFVDTELNVVHVKDVAMAHVLAIENGKPGERYIAGNKNIAFKDLLRLIADVARKKAPILAIPKVLAKIFAFIDEFNSCKLQHVDPKTPLESVAAAQFRIFDCSKAWTELKMPKTNIRLAIREV